MQKLSLAVLAASLPLMATAGSVDLGVSIGTVAFTSSDNIVLGSLSCILPAATTCSLAGGNVVSGVAFAWTFSEPKSPSPFSYASEPGSITDNPSDLSGLTFSLTDPTGDSATGTFVLTSLQSDNTPHIGGIDGVDLDGVITITQVTSGSNPTKTAAFDGLFGVPGNTTFDLTLDVGDCVAGLTPTACVAMADPTGVVLDASITAVPEPASFGMLGLAAGAMLAVRKRRRSKS